MLQEEGSKAYGWGEGWEQCPPCQQIRLYRFDMASKANFASRVSRARCTRCSSIITYLSTYRCHFAHAKSNWGIGMDVSAWLMSAAVRSPLQCQDRSGGMGPADLGSWVASTCSTVFLHVHSITLYWHEKAPAQGPAAWQSKPNSSCCKLLEELSNCCQATCSSIRGLNHLVIVFFLGDLCEHFESLSVSCGGHFGDTLSERCLCGKATEM